MSKKTISEQETNVTEKPTNWVLYVLVILLLVIALLLLLMKYKGVTIEEAQGFATTSLESLSNKKASSSNILFTGVSPYYVSSDGYVPLQNSEMNECDLKYVISDENGNVLYESISVAPGLEDRWLLENRFPTGEYTFNVNANKVLADGSLGTGIATKMVVVVQ